MICPATMESFVTPGHTHVCSVTTEHRDDSHICDGCGQTFGVGT